MKITNYFLTKSVNILLKGFLVTSFFVFSGILANAQTSQPTPTPTQQTEIKPDLTNQDVNLASNAPQDKTIQANSEQVRKFEEAIKPYVQKAKDTYPQVKKRYLQGLPTKQTFFITTRLHDKEGRMEQVFIAVKEIKGGTITGLIWSDVQLVSGFKHGDSYSFPEGELMDWTISKPDGSEEGNFVGNFLDTYQP